MCIVQRITTWKSVFLCVCGCFSIHFCYVVSCIKWTHVFGSLSTSRRHLWLHMLILILHVYCWRTCHRFSFFKRARTHTNPSCMYMCFCAWWFWNRVINTCQWVFDGMVIALTVGALLRWRKEEKEKNGKNLLTSFECNKCTFGATWFSSWVLHNRNTFDVCSSLFPPSKFKQKQLVFFLIIFVFVVTVVVVVEDVVVCMFREMVLFHLIQQHKCWITFSFNLFHLRPIFNLELKFPFDYLNKIAWLATKHHTVNGDVYFEHGRQTFSYNCKLFVFVLVFLLTKLHNTLLTNKF